MHANLRRRVLLAADGGERGEYSEKLLRRREESKNVSETHESSRAVLKRGTTVVRRNRNISTVTQREVGAAVPTGNNGKDQNEEPRGSDLSNRYIRRGRGSFKIACLNMAALMRS